MTNEPLANWVPRWVLPASETPADWSQHMDRIWVIPEYGGVHFEFDAYPDLDVYRAVFGPLPFADLDPEKWGDQA